MDESTQGPQDQAKQLYSAALSKLKAREHREALRLLAQAVKERPRYPEAYKAMSLAFLGLGDRPRGLKSLSLAAESLLVLGRDEEAQHCVRKLRELDPEATNPILDLADACLAKAELDDRQREKARRLYSLVLDADGPDSDLSRAIAGLKKTLPALQEDIVFDDPAAKSLDIALGVMSDGAPSDAPLHPLAEDAPLMEEVVLAEAPEQAPEQEEDPGERPNHERRRAQRIPLFDYSIRLAKSKSTHEAVNLSRGGVGFLIGDAPLTPGQTVLFDLLAVGKVKIKKLKAQIRHLTNGMAGCEFIELDAKQNKELDKLLKRDEPSSREPEVREGKLSLNIGSW